MYISRKMIDNIIFFTIVFNLIKIINIAKVMLNKRHLITSDLRLNL